jgi:AcrR family transcriptional regulator
MALEAAESIVAEHGYDKLSARKVAAEIGYTVGTLYLVFENIDDLILNVNARTLDRLHEQMSKAGGTAGDPMEHLAELGEIYISFADENPHLWALVFEHRLSEGHVVPDWYQQKVSRMFDLVEQALRPLAENLQAAETTQAARTIWGGVHGICVLALSDNLGIAGVESVQQMTRSLIRNYLKGFTAP